MSGELRPHGSLSDLSPGDGSHLLLWHLLRRLAARVGGSSLLNVAPQLSTQDVSGRVWWAKAV